MEHSVWTRSQLWHENIVMTKSQHIENWAHNKSQFDHNKLWIDSPDFNKLNIVIGIVDDKSI